MEDNKYDKPGNGTLFATKNRNGNMPHFQGTYICAKSYAAGEKIKFSMWQKETKYGAAYFSLRENNFVPKPANYHDKEVEYRPTAIARKHQDDDDVPF